MTPLTRLYYHTKPFLPVRLRWMLRRFYAARILRRSRDIWPIKESAGHPPQQWCGWPDQKRFAFVLTHDVEGAEGHRQVRQLAELEIALGCRSIFNFIPEGGYAVDPGLRQWLVDNGFEVGVHDLEHDGKLYASRASFREKTRRINGYLRDWNAVGFRSGFMFRRHDWLHDLEIDYDMSAFDTDPFEPQPDGAGTIFPFFVSRTLDEERNGRSDAKTTGTQARTGRGDSRSSETDPPSSAARRALRPGYVELPYTLPQDSTLFLLLRQKSIDIWIRKLEWIVRHGGMALLNVHPDYVDFGNSRNGRHCLPAALYEQFLTYVMDRHSSDLWHALPREVAEHCFPAATRAGAGSHG